MVRIVAPAAIATVILVVRAVIVIIVAITVAGCCEDGRSKKNDCKKGSTEDVALELHGYLTGNLRASSTTEVP